MTNFNGDSIIYDEIGNPTQYRDGMTFDWESGRRLASITQGTNSYSYSYDSSGVRISKTVNGTTYSYIYDNGQLIYADTPVGGMTFFYENDSVAGYKYGPEYYYYIKNLQGDIVGVIDKNCNLLYQYEYDAWGNHTVLDAQGNTISPDAPHVANFNPLRYRGYFFDTETGLYYLLSRYYDPETGRFVNADGQFSIGGELNGINLFAYCDNNPISRIDPTGEAWWHWVLGAVVVAACAVAVVATAGGAAAGVAAVYAVSTGTAAATTASTVAAGAFIGAASTYSAAVVTAAVTSNSVKEFADKGDWRTVVATAGSAVIGASITGLLNVTNKSIFTTNNIQSSRSTGRTEPNNLKEQLAMQEVRSNPLYNATQLNISLNDPRWPASDGWVKMARNVNNIEIHFVFNIKYNIFDDFKFD